MSKFLVLLFIIKHFYVFRFDILESNQAVPTDFINFHSTNILIKWSNEIIIDNLKLF